MRQRQRQTDRRTQAAREDSERYTDGDGDGEKKERCECVRDSAGRQVREIETDTKTDRHTDRQRVRGKEGYILNFRKELFDTFRSSLHANVKRLVLALFVERRVGVRKRGL